MISIKPEVTFELFVKHPGSDKWESVAIENLKVEVEEAKDGSSERTDDGGRGLDR